MKKTITHDNVFENKITKSILYLLSEYKKEGLPPRYIRYALQNEYVSQKQKKNDQELKRNIDRMKTFFKDRLNILEKNNFIKKGCIQSREQLNYYLRQLGQNNLDLIKKEGKRKKARYLIKENAYKEALKNQNKESINFFPPDKIKSFPSNSNFEKHIIYGLSDEIFKNIFTQNDRILIKNNLEKIDIFLDEIYKIKEKRLFEELNKRVNIFLKTSKNNKIKNLFKNKKYSIYGIFNNAISLNLWLNDVDICSSKTLFFFTFGILLERKIDPNGVRIRKEICDAMNKLFSLKNKKSYDLYFDSYLKEFCRIWSVTYFLKDFDLSITDIKELIQFGWDNKDLIKLAIPHEIAYSKFHIYSDEFSLKE